MSDTYSTFDCPSWKTIAALALKTAESNLVVCWLQAGSTIVLLEMDQSVADKANTDATAGSLALPGLISITDPITKAVVIVPQGVSIGVIIGAVIGSLVLIAFIVLLVVVCVRRRKTSSKTPDIAYVGLSDFPAVAKTPTYLPVPRPNSFELIMIFDVNDSGEHVLGIKAGMKCVVTAGKWFATNVPLIKP
jgi:hypothetical protein